MERSRRAVVLGTHAHEGQCFGIPHHPGWQLVHAPTLDVARIAFAQNPDIKVAIWLHDGEADPQWLQSFAQLRQSHQVVQWLAVLPPNALDDHSVAAHVAEHFVDYLTSPVAPDRLYLAAGHAEGMARLLERTTAASTHCAVDLEMVGTSEPMLALFQAIRKVAASDAPVFIAGETGTGKELTARAIHDRSSRKHGPFVAVDCGAIPSTLIQSELFGYEKGAFTGATQRRIGRIESAQGGTLFLDEIGNLPQELQVNLLRFLQQSVIHRLGSTQSIAIDTRIIAATHVNLEQAVAHRRFREDLFYRLNVLRMQVPPLRERDGDVEVLARYFLTTSAKDHGKVIRGFTRDALTLIQQHTWPGNVRELINRVRRALVMADGQWITAHDLDLPSKTRQTAEPLNLDAAREAAERAAMRRAIKLSNNNYTAAARLLDVSRPTFYRLLEKHAMSVRDGHPHDGELS